MSHVIKELADVFKITLQHATTEYAQTIWMLERSHLSFKAAQNVKRGQQRPICNNYVSNAVLKYNTFTMHRLAVN